MAKSLEPVTCPVCQNVKPPKSSKDPRCEACWRREHRRLKKAIPTALEQIAQTKRVAADAEQQARSLVDLAAEAERELQEALPEAAKSLRLAAKVAALKGDSRPAETILREYPVPTADGKGTRRLLEGLPKPGTGTGTSGPTIIIGFKLEAPPTQATSQLTVAPAPPLAAPGNPLVSGQPAIDVTAVTVDGDTASGQS